MKRMLKRGCLAFLAVVLTLAAAAQGQGTNKVDTATIRLVSGTVESVSMAPGQKHPSFALSADTGESLNVELGAYWYIVASGFSLAAGHEVNATVANCASKPDTEVVALSVENLTEGTDIQLRDEDGTPLWKGRQNGQGSGSGQDGNRNTNCYCTGEQAAPATMQEVQGKVKKLDIGLGNYKNMVKIKAKGAGKLKVALGPFWYMEQQGFSLQKGETIRVRMVQCPDCLVALFVTKVASGETLQLRDNQGVPLWIQ